MTQERHILFGLSTSLVLRVIGAVLAMGVQLATARLVGREDYGVYTYAISWVSILAVLARLGFGSSIPRFLPVMLARRQFAQYRGTVRLAFGLPLALAVSLGIAFTLVIRKSGIWSGTDYESALPVAMLALPAIALSPVRRSAMLSLRRIVWAEIPDMLLRPVAVLATLSVMYFLLEEVRAEDALVAFALAVTTGLILGSLALSRAQPEEASAHVAAYPLRSLFLVSAPMLLMDCFSAAMGDFTVLYLGWHNDPAQVAVYGAALRLTLLTGFALQAANAVLNPLISEMHHMERHKELQASLTYAARLLAIMSAIAGFVLLVFGRPLLGLFGAGFDEGYTVLLILLAGQAVSLLSGSVGSIMKMAGKQNQACIILLFAAGINIALCLLLIPRFGLYGAAISVACTQALWNIAMVLYTLKTLGLNPTILPFPNRHR